MTTSTQIEIWRQEVPPPTPESDETPPPTAATATKTPPRPKPTAAHSTMNPPTQTKSRRISSSPDRSRRKSEESKPNHNTNTITTPRRTARSPSPPKNRLNARLRRLMTSIHLTFAEREEKRRFQEFVRRGGEEPQNECEHTAMYEAWKQGVELEGPGTESWGGDALDTAKGRTARGQMNQEAKLQLAKQAYERQKRNWESMETTELVGKICSPKTWPTAAQQQQQRQQQQIAKA